MVNYKKKTAKRTRSTSNTRQKGKRMTAPSTLTSVISDNEKVPVVTSLPPAVDGHLRCFLRVSVPTIHWTIHKYPSDVQVQLKWWGEDHSDGVLFRPTDDRAGDQSTDAPSLTCVHYAVCSGPRQFNAYLKDMGPLVFDVVHGPSLVLFGQARLVDVTQLSASAPIQGFFDVVSTTGEKVALLYVVLRFESISAAYSQISSSIPTVDMEIDPQRRYVSDDDNVQPLSLPLNPSTPIANPRQMAQDTDPFVSPAAQPKAVKFAPSSPERIEYTAEHSLLSTSATDKPEVDNAEKQDDKGRASMSDLLTPGSLLQAQMDTSLSSDLIGALLQRGEKLREAMVMSADEDNELDDPEGLPSVMERNTPPGKLFKAILTSSDTDHRPDVSGMDECAVVESVILHNNKAVDLVLGEEHMHYLEESPVSSPESSIVSEPGDPLYDESLLKDLFYTTPAMQPDTDSDMTVSTDSGDDQTVTHTGTSQTKEESKISLKAKYKHHSTQITHAGKDSVKEWQTVSSVAYLDPNETSTGDKTPNPTGQHSPNSTSTDSTSTSERKPQASHPNPNEFIENLGPEKLTALGRVDAARVMVDSLGINGDNLKPGTYFVEYSFPSSTPTHCQEEDIAMASELTRVASKKLHHGVVLFNHRSVFPVLFNSAVIDYWWRRPLTFRLYFRESGQRTPVVVGLATFPLKTVLQSDCLSLSASLQIKQSLDSKQSASSLSVHHTPGSDDQRYASDICGPLLVKVELMTDGKQVHVKPSLHRKPPLPTTPTKTTERIQVTKPAQSVGQVYGVASHRTANVIKPSDKSLPQTSDKFDVVIDHDRDPITLYTLLWIPEGNTLIQLGNQGNKGNSQGLVIKNNLYLVCRMFWCDEVSKSRVCWGSTNPPFGFKQVAPVMLNLSLLQRVCNNFMVIEVWNRIGPHDRADQLLGLVKLPLHQLYLSYRDSKITTTLLKSKYPVVAVDEWSPVTNPFTGTQHGHLRVLLAMGSEEQVFTCLLV